MRQHITAIKAALAACPKIFNLLKALVVIYRKLRLELFQCFLSLRRIKKINPNHGLSKKLNISLTSYPPRFNTLHLTLISLLTQRTSPDRIVLWIAKNDIHLIPNKVNKLKKYGLEILGCEDIRSYKKIIPMINAVPREFIVTADDDVYYEPDWLSRLVRSYIENPVGVICHRGHKIRLNPSGYPLPYKEWEGDISRELQSPLAFQTGVGGVLYAPEVFDARVTDSTAFLSLCPTADDFWLYWMVRLNGSVIRILAGSKKFLVWRGSQEKALWIENTTGDVSNDSACHKLIEAYGFPIK
ncbi:glycosyltransferase [Castellaniella sp.]|uniref:glycosyltransferase n=1 Tax=Castellaniella sp. TaxID=1955812 RepID=UPI002AFEA59B|nr:glycosyltransferase [Castellaniella sp.]